MDTNDQGARYMGLVTVYLRIALGIGLLSAVADRLGLWGPPGTPNVASPRALPGLCEAVGHFGCYLLLDLNER